MQFHPTQLGELEEKVIMAVLKLGEDAYGANVRDMLLAAGRDVAIGAFYATLSRLESKGLVEGREGTVPSTRGGKPRRYFRVTGAGRRALEDNERVIANLKIQLAGSF